MVKDSGYQLAIDADYVKSNSVLMPESVFPLGTELKYVAPEILEVDCKKHLSIGSILDSTPLRWVHLPEYWIGRRMVTNGEYMAFLNFIYDEEGGKTKLFDLPEFWNYVWSDLNNRLHSVKMPMRAPDGTTYEAEENYSDCSGFVEAYMNSLRFEVERVLTASEGGGDAQEGEREVIKIKRRGQKTQRIELGGQELVPRLFAFMRYALRDSIVGPGEDGFAFLGDLERSAVEKYKSFEQVENDIRALTAQLRSSYLQSIDRRFIQAFKKGQFRVAPILFLQRMRAALAAIKDITKPVPLSLVLYPRFWDSPGGKRSRDFLKRRAEWHELPVEGITLFEALAFTVWLSTVTKMTVQLLSEAEYERAASWPAADSIEGQEKVELDPGLKDLLPWQRRNDKDFNYYFGHEGKEVDEYYVTNRSKYKELLNDTAREVPDDLLYQLTGFGWHWTSDRYDEKERKYNRFDSSEYPVYETVACCLKDGGAAVKAYAYERYSNVHSPYYVLRGSPDVLGGPGLVVRRYSAYPLRGYRKVGFRWVIKPQG